MFSSYKKAPKVCVDKIQTLASRKVCVGKVQTSATRKVCAEKIRTGRTGTGIGTGIGTPTLGSEPAAGGSGRVAYPPPLGMLPDRHVLLRTHVTRFTLTHPD